MVGVRVRLQDIMKLELLVFDERDHRVGRLGPGFGGLGLIIKHRINHHRVAGLRIINNIREGRGARVKKGLNFHWAAILLKYERLKYSLKTKTRICPRVS